MPRLHLVTATLVAAALLAACSEDPEPIIEPDPTPSVSTTAASASASPSALQSPEETVTDWVASRNAALQDGDTTDVRALSSPDCRTCFEHIEPIEDVFSAGGQFSTPGWSIDQIEITSEATASVRLDVAMTMGAGETVVAAGATPTAYPEDKRLMFFRLKSDAGSWRVSFIGYYA